MKGVLSGSDCPRNPRVQELVSTPHILSDQFWRPQGGENRAIMDLAVLPSSGSGSMACSGPAPLCKPLKQLRASLDQCLELAGNDKLLRSNELAPLRSSLFLAPAILQELFTEESRKVVKNLERRMQQYLQLDAEEIMTCLPTLRDDLERSQAATAALQSLCQALQSHLIGLMSDTRAGKGAKDRQAARHAHEKEVWGRRKVAAEAGTGVLGAAAIVAYAVASPAAAGITAASALLCGLGSKHSSSRQAVSTQQEAACREQSQLLVSMLQVTHFMESTACWMRDLFYGVQVQLREDLGDVESIQYSPLSPLGSTASPGLMEAVRAHRRSMRRAAPEIIQSCQDYQAAMKLCGQVVMDINARVGAAATRDLLLQWRVDHDAEIRTVRRGAEV